MVKQSELKGAVRLREKYEALKGELSILKAEWDTAEGKLIKRVEKEKVEAGRISATINVETRRVVAWKKVAEEYLGDAKVAAIIDGTVPTEYPRLVLDVHV